MFSVLPNLARFPASGANSNVQWCGQNFAQLPNGFGWGGQVGSAIAHCPPSGGCLQNAAAIFAIACTEGGGSSTTNTCERCCCVRVQPGYFGLYIDSTFERGMSRPCATFDNPCLASEQVQPAVCTLCWPGMRFAALSCSAGRHAAGGVLAESGSRHAVTGIVQVFEVDAVECWLVQQPEEEETPPPKPGGSVLDR